MAEPKGRPRGSKRSGTASNAPAPHQPISIASQLKKEFSESLKALNFGEASLRGDGVEFEITASDSRLSFSLTLPDAIRRGQDGYVTKLIAKHGDNDLSSVANRKWVFLSTSRLRSIMDTLKMFLDWWNEQVKPKKQQVGLRWVPKVRPQSSETPQDIPFPMDIINIISPQLTNEAYMRWCLCSKSFSILLDRDGEWQKRWFELDAVLSAFSLASCSSFKDRIALVYKAKQNMSLSQGCIYQIRPKANLPSSGWSSARMDPMDLPIGTSYIGHVDELHEYGGGSRTITRFRNVALLDLSAFPTTTRRIAIEDTRLRYSRFQVPSFLRHSNTKCADIASAFDRVAAASTATMRNLPPRFSFTISGANEVERCKQNSCPDTPWLLTRNPQDAKYVSVFDLQSRTWILQKCPWPQLATDARCEVVHFWRHYIFAGPISPDEAYLLGRLDPSSQTIVSIAKTTDVARSVAKDAKDPIVSYAGDSLWLSWLEEHVISRLRFCDIEGRRPEELKQMATSNQMELCISLHNGISHTGEFTMCGDSKIATVVNMSSKKQLCSLKARYRFSYTTWVDATTMCLECDDVVFLVDFACRDIGSGKPAYRPNSPLPVEQCRYGIVWRDNSSAQRRSVVFANLRCETLGALLAAMFPGKFVRPHSVTYDSPENIGIDIIRQQSYVWMPSKEAPTADEVALITSIDRWHHHDSRNVESYFGFLPQERADAVRLARAKDQLSNLPKGAPSKSADINGFNWPKFDGVAEAIVIAACRQDWKWLFYDIDEQSALTALERVVSQK